MCAWLAGGLAGLGRVHHLGTHVDRQHVGQVEAGAVRDAAHLLQVRRPELADRRLEPGGLAPDGRPVPPRVVREGLLVGLNRQAHAGPGRFAVLPAPLVAGALDAHVLGAGHPRSLEDLSGPGSTVRTRSMEAAAQRDLAVGGGERVRGGVGVAPARVRHHPHLGAAQVRGLAPEDGPGRAEGGPVGGDPQDGDHARTVPADSFGQGLGAFGQFGGAEFTGAGRRPGDQAGDADAPVEEVVAVAGGEPGRRVDQVISDPGSQQRRIEPVTARSEVALHGYAAQARIDPREQQPHSLGDQVRQGGAGERPQFGAGEAGAPGLLTGVIQTGPSSLATCDRRNSQPKIWHTEIRRFSGTYEGPGATGSRGPAHDYHRGRPGHAYHDRRTESVQTRPDRSLTVRDRQATDDQRDPAAPTPTARLAAAGGQVGREPGLDGPESGESSVSDPGEGSAAGSGQGSSSGGRKRSWRQLMTVVVAAIVLMLLIKAFVIQVYRIPSSSMEDTLLTGDRVLVNKLVYHFRGIDRGDIVVFSGQGSWGTTTGEPDPAPPQQPGAAGSG